MTLGKLPNILEPQFSYQQNEDNFIAVRIKWIDKCKVFETVAQRKCSVNITPVTKHLLSSC